MRNFWVQTMVQSVCMTQESKPTLGKDNEVSKQGSKKKGLS